MINEISEKMLKNMRAGFSISGAGLAVTTTVAANFMFRGWLVNAHLPEWMAASIPFLAVLGAIIFMRLIDGNLSHSMKVALLYAFGQPHVKAELKAKFRGAIVVIGMFAAITFGISAFFTFISAAFVSEAIVEAPEDVDKKANAYREATETAYLKKKDAINQSISEAKANLEEVKATASADLAKTRKDYDLATRQYIASLGKDFEQSWYNSNGWLRGERKWKNAVAKTDAFIAEKQEKLRKMEEYAEVRIANAQKLVDKASEGLAYHASEGSKASDETVNKLVGSTVGLVDIYIRSLRRLTSSLWYIDAVFAIMFLLCGVTLAKANAFVYERGFGDVFDDAIKNLRKTMIDGISVRMGAQPAFATEGGYYQGNDPYEKKEYGEGLYEEKGYGEGLYEESYGGCEDNSCFDNNPVDTPPAAEWDVNDVARARAQMSVYYKRATDEDSSAATRQRNLDKFLGFRKTLRDANASYDSKYDQI